MVIAVATSGLAQNSDPPSNAPFQAGPLVLAPVLQLTNVGHDSNIFNSTENPQGDVTATFTPSVDGWLRMAHGRISGRTQMDVYYFRTLTDLRGSDNDSWVNAEVPVNRLKPYFSGTLTDTRYRQGLEIDALERRRAQSLTTGVDVRVTAKTTVGVFERYSRLRYHANSLYRDTDLAQVLNHSSRGAGANVQYAVTPFTSVVVEGERTTDDFDFEKNRNSQNVRVTTGVAFNPRALISGSASIGFQQRRFVADNAPATAKGTYFLADLSYLLLGRTRFTFYGRRQLDYSYLIGQPAYINAGITLGINHRVTDAWEVGGSVGRYRVLYTQDPSNVESLFYGSADETAFMSDGQVAYRLGHSRVGLQVQYQQRLTDKPDIERTYHRVRIGSTFAYTF